MSNEKVQKNEKGFATLSEIPGAEKALKEALGIKPVQCPHCDEIMFLSTKEVK